MHQIFNIAWDDQSNLVINGRPFSEYLKYYEIRLYDGEAYIKSFYSPTNAFNLTLALNETKIRKPTLGVIAQGYSTGTYSPEVKITVQKISNVKLAHWLYYCRWIRELIL